MSTTSKVRRVNQREAVRVIRDRQPFRASALSGRHVRHGESTLGSLPAPERELFREAERKADAQGDQLYVIFSYETPIAWVLGEDVVIPAVRYSLTTTQHQWTARHALGRSTVDTPSKGRAVGVGTYGPRQSW